MRRPLDLGLRPGKVWPFNDEVFGKLAGTLPRSSLSPKVNHPALARPIALNSSGDITALTAALEQAVDRDGLCAFALNTFAPLPTTLGALWAGRQPQIFEVHLLTRHLVRSLDVAMSRVGRPAGDPEVLLATLPGERHVLGLLMVEALLMHAGRATLNLAQRCRSI